MENKDMKIKDKFPINLSSRSEEKRIKFTKWLNAQSNAQNSFLALVEHMVDRFGFADVTEHEIAKKLFTEKLEFENTPVQPIKVIRPQSSVENNSAVETSLNEDPAVINESYEDLEPESDVQRNFNPDNF